jgi:Flp pilus assembly pilin Flp
VSRTERVEPGPWGEARAEPSPGRGATAARHPSGQGIVEYGLILVLAVAVCVVSLVVFGDQVSALLNLIASAI